MSDSRLEKFIYAICSMDVSDLPVPLSRIEKLWNCLITGETPDFEPLSRNEKYLMAMLDRYDISNLPAPMSRGEKLLYKIAVGETDLSDVPGYLSRYEELLKYLIENGENSEDDFEYVLHTLNQSMYTLYTTAEKPVKRAILKGQTLVNIDSYYGGGDFYIYGADYIDGDGFVQLTARGAWVNAHTHNNSLVKPNTKYAIIVDIKENTLDSSMSNAFKICTNTDTLESVWSSINGIDIAGGVTGRLFFTATTSNKVSGVKMLQRSYIGSALKTGHIKYRWMIIEYQEGMENWDIPYFRGMTSVKMPVLTTTGKNLFDGEFELDKYLQKNGTLGASANWATTKNYISVRPNTTYTQNIQMNSPVVHVIFYDKNKNIVGAEIGSNVNNFVTYTTPNNCYYIKTCYNYGSVGNHLFQVEEGSTSTAYEPYKSNILSSSEDVTLRGIGDVKDEMNLMTGEVVERVGEVVLNGSESWKTGSWYNQVESIGFQIKIKNDVNPSVYVKAISDKILYNSSNIFQKDGEYFDMVGAGNGETWIRIRILRSKLSTEDVEGFKKWLSQNNVKILYELSDKPIKTVDLTVVDQDNQSTQLGTFENVTHVSLEAENLIPEVELEVATRISTELASASPLMDDILNEQQQLNTTIDEQSENVDATMIATTEIYEEIL